MHAIGLTFVDWLIIAVYFGFVLGIGFYLRVYTKTEEDFFLAGRQIAWRPAIIWTFISVMAGMSIMLRDKSFLFCDTANCRSGQ